MSLQRPCCRASRSRLPTIVKPAARCSATLASFSGGARLERRVTFVDAGLIDRKNLWGMLCRHRLNPYGTGRRWRRVHHP